MQNPIGSKFMGIICNLPNIYLATKYAIVSILHERNEGQYIYIYIYIFFSKIEIRGNWLCNWNIIIIFLIEKNVLCTGF